MNSGDLAIILFLSLLAHGWGDYIVQTNWMATEKVKRWSPAVLHAFTYTLAFVPLILITGARPLAQAGALMIIGGTHAIIDRHLLARHIIWAKNRLGGDRTPWSQCTKYGSSEKVPDFIAKWLMTIVDNTVHVTINSLAIIWVAGWAL